MCYIRVDRSVSVSYGAQAHLALRFWWRSPLDTTAADNLWHALCILCALPECDLRELYPVALGSPLKAKWSNKQTATNHSVPRRELAALSPKTYDRGMQTSERCDEIQIKGTVQTFTLCLDDIHALYHHIYECHQSITFYFSGKSPRPPSHLDGTLCSCLAGSTDVMLSWQASDRVLV